MRIAIFGLGYVGSTAAGCLASQGHDVIGVDISETKVEAINAGRAPVFEPGLDELISTAVAQGRLKAQQEIRDALTDCDAGIVCVGTPSGVDGAHDMRFIVQVTRSIAAALTVNRDAPLTLAFRSTMRPGSMEKIIQPIFEAEHGDKTASVVELVYNPEFLREASAIEDYFNPPKIVVGTLDGKPNANIQSLHAGIEAPTFHVGMREAELTKFVDNSWHAVKVAFANEVGRVCQLNDVSAGDVHKVFVSDTKLNISSHYLKPGGAFGGSCLPKDVRALQYIASDSGAHTHMIDALLRSNEAHKHHQFLAATDGLKPGAKVLLIGLAFKQGTDDLRESPAVDLARKLLDAGYDLDVYDPHVEPTALIGQNLGYAMSILPSIDNLLVDRDGAESGVYARVITTNSLHRELDLGDVELIDLSVIP